MSRMESPLTSRKYGVEKVCGAFEFPRSSFYNAAHRKPANPNPQKCGPKPAVCDDSLLGFIKADLKRSPFKGEGYRKVWASQDH